MDIKITPKKLCGAVTVPPSKSVAHRMIIAAALADGRSVITNLSGSEDIKATVECMRNLGARIELEGSTAVIEGIKKAPDKAVLDCRESGSTLRFIIPIACALGVDATFVGSGKLPERPITPFLEEFPKHGITCDLSQAESGCTLPCNFFGKATAGEYKIGGGVSSQFITGMMFQLPLLDGDSEIVLTSPLQSKPYVDITMDVLRSFGCEIGEMERGYSVKGNQRLKPFSGTVEGDYSQAAFFYTANALGSELEIDGLNERSYQGDKAITGICERFAETREAFTLDCSDIPDLVPILSVLACFGRGTSRLENVARLRIKECDRLAAMEDCLNRIGGKVTSGDDFLQIEGVETLKGGDVQTYNDHRIAMSMAIAATMCEEPLIIRGAECVRKSFPNFFDLYGALGGEFEEL